MKLAFRGIDPFLKNPPVHVLAILLYGPDEGLVRERSRGLVDKFGVDTSDPFAIADIAPGQLSENPAIVLDEAQSISMLGGRRVVRLRLLDSPDKASAALQSALKAMKEGDNPVIVEAGELGPRSPLRLLFENADNAAAVPCYKDDERDLPRIIGEELRGAGFRISSDALGYMAANVVGNRAVARMEAEKLMTYMGGQRDIGIDDVTACIGAGGQLPLDDLTRYMCSGQFAEADRVLRLALGEGSNAVALLRHMQNYFLKLQITKTRVDKGEAFKIAIKKLRPPLFFKLEDSFGAQMRGWTFEQIAQALSLLTSAEARCKQTGAEPDLIVGRAVMALSQMGAKAVSQRRYG